MKKFKFLALTALFCALGVNAFAETKYALKEDANGNEVWYQYDDALNAGTQADPYQAIVWGVNESDDAIDELVIRADFQWKSPAGKPMYFQVTGFDANWAKQSVPATIEGEAVTFDVAIIVTLNSLTVNIDNFAIAGLTNMDAGLKRLASLTLIDSKKNATTGAPEPTPLGFYDLDLSELTCKSLTTLDIAKTGITVIPANAFKTSNKSTDPNYKWWAKLTSVTLPDGLKAIQNNAFESFKGKTITFPGSLEEIGVSAFKGATGLEAITIPAATTTIAYGAFEGCTGLKTVTFATYANGEKTGKSDVETIGWDAFKGCTGLTSIDLSKTAITDGLGAAFTGCTGITAITLSDNVTKLVGGLFKDTKVEEITALGAVEVGAIMGASKKTPNNTLKKVTLGPVEKLSSNAFAYCYALEEATVDFPDDDDAKAAVKAIEDALANAEADAEAAEAAYYEALGDVVTYQGKVDEATAAFVEASAAVAAIKEAKADLFAAITEVGAAEPAADITDADLATLVGDIADVATQYALYADYVEDKAEVDAQVAAAIAAIKEAEGYADDADAIAWATNVANAEDPLAIAYNEAVTALAALVDPTADFKDAIVDATIIPLADIDAEFDGFVEGYDEDDFDAVATAYTAYTAALDESDLATAEATKAEALTALGEAAEDLSDAQEAAGKAYDKMLEKQADAEAAAENNEAAIVLAKAFYYCTGLATFNYSPTNDAYKYVSDNAFLGCSSNPLVHFVTSTVYMAKYTAPFQTTYNNEAATTVKTVADKGTSGKFFNKFHATSKVAIDPAEAKVYSVYVDEGAAVLQGLAKKEDMYVIFPDQNVIIKTDEAKEVEIIPYNGTTKKSSVLIDDIWCFDGDVALADFQENYVDAQGNPAIVTGEYVYRLTNNAASGGFGFTYYTGTTLKKGQFHIVSNVAPAADGRIIKTIWLDEEGNVESVDELTGISTIAVENVADDAIYNMAGQKVSKNYKGVVIKNGKKVILK